MQRAEDSRSRRRHYGSPQATLSEETALIVVKPIFFLAVFLEHLTYSFLPKFMQDAAAASGVSLGFAAAPFTAYYLCFALSLIPAGHFSDRYGPKPLIWPGLILASASILGLMLPLGIIPMTALRALSGIGQGMLFIGIQSLHPRRRLPREEDPGQRDHRVRLPGRHDLRHGDRIAAGQLPASARRLRRVRRDRHWPRRSTASC